MSVPPAIASSTSPVYCAASKAIYARSWLCRLYIQRTLELRWSSYQPLFPLLWKSKRKEQWRRMTTIMTSCSTRVSKMRRTLSRRWPSRSTGPKVNSFHRILSERYLRHNTSIVWPPPEAPVNRSFDFLETASRRSFQPICDEVARGVYGKKRWRAREESGCDGYETNNTATRTTHLHNHIFAKCWFS